MDRRRHRYAEVEYEQRHRDGKYAIAQRSQTFGALAGNPQGAEKLLDAVTAGKASERLLWEWSVNVRLTKHARVKDRLAKLTRSPLVARRTISTGNAVIRRPRQSVADRPPSRPLQRAGRGARLGARGRES